LRNHDLIVAIPTKTDPKITERWTTITRDDDACSDSVRILANVMEIDLRKAPD
jgi:hypothetical protein